jgi:hypothetical protein
LFAKPPSIKLEATIIDSIKVEHAPNNPMYGMFDSLYAKLDAIHWFNKSPAKQKSISLGGMFAFAIRELTVSFTILLSAFSQDFSPQNSSSKRVSK